MKTAWAAWDVAPAGLGVAVGLGVATHPSLVLLALGVLAVAAAGVARPWLLVVGMFLGMLFDRLGALGLQLGNLPLTAAKLSVLAAAGLWAVHAAWRGVRILRWHPVLGGMLGVVGTTAFGIAWSHCYDVGRFDLIGLGMMSVLVSLVYTILAETELTPLYRALAVVFALVLVGSLGGAGDRATGPMGDPNEWATLVLLVTPFLLGGLAGDEGRGAGALRVALVLLASLALLRSGSRAALVAGVPVSLGCVYLLRRRRAEIAGTTGLAAVAGAFVLDLGEALMRFRLLLQGVRVGAQAEDPSFTERFELFRQGMELFGDHWVLGSGPGTFPLATGFVSTSGTLRPAHDTWLRIAGEQGIVGLVAVGVLVGLVVATLRGGLRASPRPEEAARIVGIALGLGAVAAMAVTLELLVFAMAWLVLGFGLAVVRQTQAPVGGPDEGRG